MDCTGGSHCKAPQSFSERHVCAECPNEACHSMLNEILEPVAFSEIYGTGKHRTVVVSKCALPSYLPKYDPKSSQEDWIEMSEETRDAVQEALNAMCNPYTQHLYKGFNQGVDFVEKFAHFGAMLQGILPVYKA